MKKKIKFLSVLLSTLLLLCLCNPDVYATTTIDAMAQDNLYMTRVYAASDVYNTLLEQITNADNNYAADYCGAYMDENGTLVICVLDEAAIQTYEDILTTEVIEVSVQGARTLSAQEGRVIGSRSAIISEGLVRYETRTYSYNTLDGLQNLLDERMSDFEISTTSIVQRENVLYVSTVNDNLRSEILTYIQSAGYSVDLIIFEHADDYGGLSATIVNPGSQITGVDYDNGSLAQYGTLGFYAKTGSTYGIVTAGHVVGSDNSIVRYGSLSSLNATNFQQGGNLDAAFLPISTSTFTPTGSVACGSSTAIIRSYAAPTESYVVSVYGAATGSAWTASVRSTSVTHYASSATYTDLIQLSTKGVSGDSGAPVLFGSVLYGIYHGYSGSYGLVCKATNILSTWGLTLVTGS